MTRSNYQLDAGNLSRVFNYTGRSTTFDGGEPIYAEDRKGTFAVGATAIYDAELLHPVAALPRVAYAATLMAGDKELWYQSGGSLYYINAPQFLTGATLGGDRRVAPEATSAHEVTHFIVDSKRNRLYALDLLDDLLIAIDGTTLKPIAALRTNRGPSDIDMDLAQNSIYVAHRDNTQLLRVNADTFTVEQTLWMSGEIAVIRARLADPTCFVSADVIGLHEQIALHDLANGAVLATTDNVNMVPLLGGIAVAADNKTIYVGNAVLETDQLYRFVVQRPYLTLTGTTRHDMGFGFPGPSGSTLMTPDGKNIFFARYAISGSNLDVLNYKVDDPMMAVTLDGRLAASNDHVFRTADGVVVMTLPKYTTEGPQGVAFTPDGKTLILTPPHAPMLTFDVSAL